VTCLLPCILFSCVKNGFTALLSASGGGHEDVVEMLLKGGADIDKNVDKVRET
jgi:ankyrin repeat protein